MRKKIANNEEDWVDENIFETKQKIKMMALKKRLSSTISKESTDSEEFSTCTSNIDSSIVSNCKKSKLKIVFMHKSDLKKLRPVLTK